MLLRTTLQATAARRPSHFSPIHLVDILVAAERSEHRKCSRWPGLDFPGANDGLCKTVLRRTVCTVMMRDQVDRKIAAYYEWTWKKHSNLTAIQYLNLNGPGTYLKLVGWQSHFVFLATLESCLVGVTERMGEFVTTLSRVLRIDPPKSGSVESAGRISTLV